MQIKIDRLQWKICFSVSPAGWKNENQKELGEIEEEFAGQA